MKPPFRTTYWQNYPPPFYPDSSGRYPVPGWGARPVMAGPARLGVGQDTIKLSAGQRAAFAPRLRDAAIAAHKPPVPTYVWIMATAFAVGGALAYASNKGWFKGLKR